MQFPRLRKFLEAKPLSLFLLAIAGGIYYQGKQIWATFKNLESVIAERFVVEYVAMGTDPGFDSLQHHINEVLKPRNFSTSYFVRSVFTRKAELLIDSEPTRSHAQHHPLSITKPGGLPTYHKIYSFFNKLIFSGKGKSADEHGQRENPNEPTSEEKARPISSDRVHSFVCDQQPEWEYHFVRWYLPILLKRRANDERGGGKISIIGPRCTGAIREILHQASQHQIQTTNQYTQVYTACEGRWAPGISKPLRSMDTVEMEAADKKRLLDSVDLFVEEGRREFYGTVAIPYRTGYLLYGPPGTGKSSCAMGIAGRTRRDVYMISLLDKEMDDNRLLQLLHTIPEAAVILFEDVDSAGIGREAKVEDDLSGELQRGSDVAIDDEDHETERKLSGFEEQRSMVTYSGLLNAIDGPLATEIGHIIVMTTNCREKLDDALIRDGRCNIEVYFGHATQKMAEGMFIRIMKVSVNTYHPTGEAHTSPDAMEEAVTDAKMKKDFGNGKKKNAECHAVAANALTANQMLHDLAEQFAAKIPAETFTPAQLLNYLMKNIDGPKRAVDDFGAWEQRQYADRKQREAEKSRAAEKRVGQLEEWRERGALLRKERRKVTAPGQTKQRTQVSIYRRGGRSKRTRGGSGIVIAGDGHAASNYHDGSHGWGSDTAGW